MMKFRNEQTQMLIDAFKMAGILLDLYEVVDDKHPFADAGDDFVMSRHGNQQAFIFQNVDGGKLLFVSPTENPNFKYRVLATHQLESANDAYKIACEYSLIFGGDLVA